MCGGWSLFTLLFDALVMAMVSRMPVKTVACSGGEHDTWPLANRKVLRGRGEAGAAEHVDICAAAHQAQPFQPK